MPYAINVSSRSATLASRNRNPEMKAALLAYYGSFAEMALCGVTPFGRTGYAVLLNPCREKCYGGDGGDSLGVLQADIAGDVFWRGHCYKAKAGR